MRSITDNFLKARIIETTLVFVAKLHVGLVVDARDLLPQSYLFGCG